jgi:hypothetical protein
LKTRNRSLNSGVMCLLCLFSLVFCVKKPSESKGRTHSQSESEEEPSASKKEEAKKGLEAVLKWMQENHQLAQRHILGIIERNPYRSFAQDPKSSASLADEELWDPIQDFNQADSVAPIPVPEDPQELEQFQKTLSTLSLAEEKPVQKKKTLNGLMKGLYNSLNCSSPIRALYVFAATEHLGLERVLEAAGRFRVVPVESVWNTVPGALAGLFPNQLVRGIAASLAGGITFEGGDAILGLKVVGPHFFKLKFLKTLEYSVRNGPKHGMLLGNELSGAPVPWIPNTTAAIGWNAEEGSVLIFQEVGEMEVGIQIAISGKKLTQLIKPNSRKCLKSEIKK